MKPLPILLVAACVFVAACSQSRPPPRRPLPSPNPLPPATHPGPVAKENHPSPPAPTLIRPAPTKATPPTSTPWPVRRAPAFTPETLPERLALSPAQILEMRDDIRRWIATPLLPSGEKLSLYQTGVTTLDDWLHYGPIPHDTPPDTPTYYEMVYHDGYPTEVYRHEAGERTIRLRVYYAEPMIPVCSIRYGADGNPTSFTHLTYEPSGLIRQVVVLDEHGEPVRGVCHAHEGVYARTESVHYDLKRSGIRSHHSLHDGDYVYHIAPDGTRKQVNRGHQLWRLTSLSSFGVKPLYPLPTGFVVPAFNRYGQPEK